MKPSIIKQRGAASEFSKAENDQVVVMTFAGDTIPGKCLVNYGGEMNRKQTRERKRN